MSRKTLIAVAALPIALAATGLANADELQPGGWESTGQLTDVHMPGVPPEVADAMKKRQTQQKFCISPEQAQNPRKMFQSQSEDCTSSDFHMSGGKIRSAMQCAGEDGPTRVMMFGTYTKTSFTSTTIMKMETAEGPASMTTRTVSKYSGKCEQKSAK